MISFISLKSMAGDGDKFFNISGGWQWKNTVNAPGDEGGGVGLGGLGFVVRILL